MSSEEPVPEIPGGEIAEVLDEVALAFWRALEPQIGRPSLFDAHTHLGTNDPDGHRQTPAELLAALERADARAVTFAMQEPAGYGPANDAVLQAAADSGGRLVAYCRVDPHRDALTEAQRCLEAGARGIKLHPRAEAFTLGEPAVRELIALAHERRLPVLIHAGRGIPALGRDALGLASEFPDARLILAHAAVSDFAWLWRELPGHPNLLVDTAWWTPGDMVALFSLAPPGQILWASDSPYSPPLASAVQHFSYALQAGLGSEAIDCMAGAQLERILAGDELMAAPGAAAVDEPLDPLLERVVAHLVAAVARCTGLADPAEPIALARLACAVESGPLAPRCAAVLGLLDRAEEHLPAPPGVRWGVGAQLLAFAIAVARCPAAALPAWDSGPPSREHAEDGG